MPDLVVRVYNVRCGDAILVSIPDEESGRPVERTILFDFGNALTREGGVDDVLVPVIDDLIERLGGRPLDLYVMTHEHLDHVQGLFYAAEVHGKTIAATQAWLTGSAAPDYYATHPDARKKRLAALAAFRMTAARVAPLAAVSPTLGILLANNDTRTTARCIDYVRERLTPPGGVRYVDRETDLSTLQPAPSATVTLLAPEEDTADYYARFSALASGLRIGEAGGLGGDGAGGAGGPAAGAAGDDVLGDFDDLDLDQGLGLGPAGEVMLPDPPPGVDAGTFYNLLDIRHGNAAGTLLAIDKARNNTSIVLLLEWNGWRLLFTGDAEKHSWRKMDELGLIDGPVHFLKVSHHGSETGMPPDDILDKLLPRRGAGPRPQAAVSTFPGNYNGVPNELTLGALRTRVDLRSTLDLAAGELFLEYRFPDTGPA